MTDPTPKDTLRTMLIEMATHASTLEADGMSMEAKGRKVAGDARSVLFIAQAALPLLEQIDETPTEPEPKLEPINPAITQIALTVVPGERQTYEGFGWSSPTSTTENSMSLLTTHATALFEDLDTKIIRIWYHTNPADAINIHVDSGYIALCLAHGIDRFLLGPTKYTGSNPTGYATALASEINDMIDGGIPLTHIGVQNEPGSGGRPDIAKPDMAPMLSTLRSQLNSRGLSAVKIIAPEYASGDSRPDSFFNVMSAAGALGFVSSGAHHSYNMAARPELYDQRWKTAGKGLWQTEAGNASIPTTGARFLNDLNHGCEAWIFFIGLVDRPGDLSQKLISWQGHKNPWFNTCALISKAVVRGSRPRLVRGNVPMVYTYGVKPKINASMGLRPDGKWYLGVQNGTWGESVSGGFGHHGAERLQVTITAPELHGKDAMFDGSRLSAESEITPQRYPMVDGVMRVTLAERELLVLTGG